MTNRIARPNWYDGQHVSLEDMNAEQGSNLSQVAAASTTAFGTGVRLEFPEEPIIFDSNQLTTTQSGFVAVNTFDGRGILAEPYTSTDTSEGNQIAVAVSDARLDGVLSLTTTIIGKTFDDSLIFEHLTFSNNGYRVTHNHFKEVTNILFQNFKGNANTSVDGYGSFRTDGRVIVSEASSMRVSHDLIVDEQIAEPEIIFRDYKVYDSGKTLDTVLSEAVGTSNDIDDLDINTTVAQQRKFEAGDTTELIYAQKFQMQGTNIQKITLLLGLESGTDWSGSLIVGIRSLQTSTSCPTDFLPDNEIDFDPSVVPVEEIAIDQDDLAERGIVLNSSTQPVDFIFTNSNIANPSLSNLVSGDFYVLTVRRTGSTSTGTLLLDEARNENSSLRKLTVFDNRQWTDVPSSTLWYRIWGDSVKIANGVAYDEGTRLTIPKTTIDNNGVRIQNSVQNLNLVDTSEDTENYIIVQKTLEFKDVESHPRTGDSIFAQEEDAPEFSILEQSDTLDLLDINQELVVLAKVSDTNPRSNPEISGTLDYPGLALDNVINIVNPSSDLLVQNVVGSTIIPNSSKPTLQYRIISQETFTDLIGDVDGNSEINLLDANRVGELDGYTSLLAGGSVSDSEQQAAILNGSVSILEILKSDLNQDGYVTSSDLVELNAFIDSGTAFSGGETAITRVQLKVEPIINPHFYLDTTANSTLQLEVEDPDLIDNSGYTPISFSISFVPVWDAEHIDITDLRRNTHTTFIDFEASDLQTQPENGGQNNFLVAGDLYLASSVKNLDGSFHPLDYEQTTIELELPEGDTEGTINIFDRYVDGLMSFSDGTLVSSSAINNNQVHFDVSVGSHVKNLASSAIDTGGLGSLTSDGYGLDFDGYNDGYGANADEVIGTYLNHSTGLLRIRAFNVVRNEFFPELRTRILITVSLKKAGFANEPIEVSSTDLSALLTAIT